MLALYQIKRTQKAMFSSHLIKLLDLKLKRIAASEIFKISFFLLCYNYCSIFEPFGPVGLVGPVGPFGPVGPVDPDLFSWSIWSR